MMVDFALASGVKNSFDFLQSNLQEIGISITLIDVANNALTLANSFVLATYFLAKTKNLFRH